MSKVTDVLSQVDRPVFICDFTPPRGADPALLDGAAQLQKADFISVAYNPGKLVRLDSVTAAHLIRQRFDRDVIFNLSPRDMNKIALESRLLGAAAIGLENVLVVQGDRITERDAATEVPDYTASGLVRAVSSLNESLDYRGGKLRSATDCCIGASIDLGREAGREVALTKRKVDAGTQFFVTQPVFSVGEIDAFRAAYRDHSGQDLDTPVFWGIQILAKDGVLFSSVPDEVRGQLEGGRDGVEIALEVFGALSSRGERSFYIVAPILRGGARDYEATSRFLDAIL